MNKRTIAVWTLFLTLLASCGAESRPGVPLPSDTTTYYPYAPVYTDSFSGGRPAQVVQVLTIWKELEHGDVRKLSASFADTLFLSLPDLVFSGSRDSALALLYRLRQQCSDVQFYTDAWLPLRADSRSEDLVLLWGRQDCTMPGGKRRYQVIHEVWKFDPNGKIKALTQYRTHPH